jgi:hypothetical protein
MFQARIKRVFERDQASFFLPEIFSNPSSRIGASKGPEAPQPSGISRVLVSLRFLSIR